jgi:hypothetical protein
VAWFNRENSKSMKSDEARNHVYKHNRLLLVVSKNSLEANNYLEKHPKDIPSNLPREILDKLRESG